MTTNDDSEIETPHDFLMRIYGKTMHEATAMLVDYIERIKNANSTTNS